MGKDTNYDIHIFQKVEGRKRKKGKKHNKMKNIVKLFSHFYG